MGNWICTQKRSHLEREVNGNVMTIRYSNVQKVLEFKISIKIDINKI